ncbi:unnamed protein product [Didymodactylos carnosus]|uniref:PDZ domain-containing protein n=1 Tax=Didymodactylos carnosus TaxID=1234261 RepID=A0A814PQD8_9BILA|nr:unnamed protein product [Didymodactylos carnosus]CAF1149770.1 unnamed protein product [Didymodactylos carnosus]CAF3873793.1 unnamed protein product [Didymodactylos carnosus]CAF3955117.1 unnamed protein product [Didymodactylos carnosus]
MQLRPTFQAYGFWLKKANKNTSDYHIISDVFDNTPTQAAGLKVNDGIIEVNNENVTNLDQAELKQRCIQKTGSNECTLLVLDSICNKRLSKINVTSSDKNVIHCGVRAISELNTGNIQNVENRSSMSSSNNYLLSMFRPPKLMTLKKSDKPLTIHSQSAPPSGNYLLSLFRPPKNPRSTVAIPQLAFAVSAPVHQEPVSQGHSQSQIFRPAMTTVVYAPSASPSTTKPKEIKLNVSNPSVNLIESFSLVQEKPSTLRTQLHLQKGSANKVYTESMIDFDLPTRKPDLSFAADETVSGE